MIELYGLGALLGMGYMMNKENQDKKNLESTIKNNEKFSKPFYSVKELDMSNGEKNIHQSNRFENIRQATQMKADDHVQNSPYSKGVIHPETKEITISKLSGQPMGKEDFKHNNMVPFFSSRQGINQPFLDKSQNRRILDTHSGGEQYAVGKKELERKEFFEPQQNLGNIYGTRAVVEENYRENQINPGTIRIANNVKPFEEQRVGPGIGGGFTNTPSGGFQQNSTQDYLLNTMRNVDDLRTTNNPKKIFEGRALAPPSNLVAGRTGSVGIHKVSDRKPEGESYFGSGAPASATIRKVDPTVALKTTVRGDGASVPVSNVSRISKQQQTQSTVNSTNQPLNAFFQPLNPVARDTLHLPSEDHNRENFELKPNERTAQPDWENKNISNVRKPIPVQNSGYNDYQIPSKKEFLSANGRMFGSVGGNVKGQIQHMEDFQPTVKDTTQNYYQMQQNFRGIEDPNTQISIENCDNRQQQYVEGFKTPSGGNTLLNAPKIGQRVFDLEGTVPEPTMRQGTQDNIYEGIVGHSQLRKGGHQVIAKDIKGTVRKHDEHFTPLKSVGPTGQTGYLNSSFFNTNNDQNNRYGGENVKGKLVRHEAYTGIAGDTMGISQHTKMDVKFEPTAFRQTLKAPRKLVIEEGPKVAQGKQDFNFDLKRQLNGVSYRSLNNIEKQYQQPQYDRQLGKTTQSYSEKQQVNRFNDGTLLDAYKNNPYTQSFTNIAGNGRPGHM